MTMNGSRTVVASNDQKNVDNADGMLPLGSGVTEAACKTVFTQRLKNSGMRWSHDGAKTILTLRTILLSRSCQT